MPGFNIDGGYRNGPNPIAEVRRTYRWVFQSIGHLPGSREILLLLRSASRPSVSMEQVEMHHQQERVYYAGKHTFEPITMTWYDVEQDPDVSDAMWRWINVCLDLPGMTVAAPSSYKRNNSELRMRDGRGNTTESWRLYHGWPANVNWEGLDYTSTDLQVIEVEFRYDRAVRLGGRRGLGVNISF